ncbi:MAG: ABC transporter substrate-binding protein [Crocinitomicaceae bacterium]
MKPISFTYLWLLVAVVFSSCQDPVVENTLNRNAKGDVIYGSILKFQSPEKVDILFPLATTNSYARNITCQMYEPLLKTDMRTMRTIPNIAKSFEVSENGDVYTLKIRKDVYFHPDPCFGETPRKLTVEDVKYSLDLACSGLEINKASYLLLNKIKGARQYNAKTKTKLTRSGVSGIKVLSDSTVSIELEEAFSGFEKILSHNSLSMVPREAIEMYGKEILTHPVGTGPFILESVTNEKISLKRFDKYWRKDKLGNALPYLDGVEMTYSKGKKEELENFRNEKIDLVLNIPVEQIDYILGSLQDAQKGENVIHKVHSEPSMSITYIGFANESREFRDVRVRKAFNMAVNRSELVNNWLSGEGWPAEHGFIPPLDFYPNDDVKPLPYDTIVAQKLLAEAGYPGGRGFPKVEIYVNAQENSPAHKMTLGIVDQIKRNLGIDLGIELCTIGERDRAIENGTAKIWRAGWIADYAYPENFLSLFYSRNIGKNNPVNSFHYRSAEFDDILDQAIKEQNEMIRNQFFVIADQKVVDDAVCMPILTDDLIVLVNVKVKNFIPNPMEILDLSTIFIKAPRR